MIDIKNNLEIMWIYFPENEHEILQELNESSAFDFYERYLLELSASEFLDFFQYLSAFCLNKDIHIEKTAYCNLNSNSKTVDIAPFIFPERYSPNQKAILLENSSLHMAVTAT